MKLYVLLVLCLTVVYGEKKINLEDIERDNLQSEAESEQENVSEDNTKYSSDKAEGNPQLQYQTEARFGGQQAQDIKYVPQIQPEAYSQSFQAYQQQQQQEQQQQQSQQLSQRPQQFYIPNYQPEAAAYQIPKSSPKISYQPQLTQGLTYQDEVPVGNQIQSYQQKVATQKFGTGFEKEFIAPRFQNVAATEVQQPLYRPPPSVTIEKTSPQPLLHQLASQAVRKLQLPAYTTSVSYEPKVTYQPQPQIQYVFEPQYVPVAAPAYNAPKSTQKFTYAAPAAAPAPAAAAPQTYRSPQAYSGLTYSSQQSSLSTQPKLAYTQAYYIQPQLTQYYQEPAYTPSLQSNSLGYSQPQAQQFYIPSNLLAQQLSSQFLEQQTSHSLPQNYAKVPETQRFTLATAQIPAQSFKSVPITQLRPVHSSNQIYYSSGPRSLLESYTPSRIIAASDSERYRERPLHLEGGFLPSKGSFTHSYNHKRKV